MSKTSESDDLNDQEMLDVADQLSFQPQMIDVSMASRSVSSRGPKKIPEQWCRVVSMELDTLEALVTTSIYLDQQLPMLKADVPKKAKHKQWKPVFQAKEFLRGVGQLDLED